MKRKYIFLLTFIFIITCFNMVYAQGSITCSVSVNKQNISVTGQVEEVTNICEVALLVGNEDKIIYLDQTQSDADGRFNFNFKLPRSLPSGAYDLTIGSDAGCAPYKGVLNYTAEQKFVDADVTVSIKNYIPSITGTLSCTEGKSITLNITNTTDGTVIANNTITAADGNYALSYSLPSLLRARDYTVAVSCTDGTDELLGMSVGISSSVVLVSINGVVNTAENVRVDAGVQSTMTDFIDKSTSITGSKTITATIPNIVSNASFHLTARGYELEAEQEPDPEPDTDPDSGSIDEPIIINEDKIWQLHINPSGESSWYSIEPKYSGLYNINFPDNYNVELFKAAINGLESIPVTGEVFLEYPQKYYLNISAGTGANGRLSLEISGAESRTAGKAFETVMSNDRYYSNIKDMGKLYKNTARLINTENLNTVFWMCNFNDVMYFNSGGSLYMLTDASYQIVGDGIDARYIVSDETNIYFSNWSDGGKLYRGTVLADNTMSFEKVCEDSAAWIEPDGDYLYYKNNLDGGKKYRVLKTSQNMISGEVVE